MDSSSSRPDAKSRCRPVTMFSRRPASPPGFTSPRTFSTYARRLGYFASVLRVIVGDTALPRRAPEMRTTHDGLQRLIGSTMDVDA